MQGALTTERLGHTGQGIEQRRFARAVFTAQHGAFARVKRCIGGEQWLLFVVADNQLFQ